MTSWRTRFDVIQNVLEWLLVGLMLFAAVTLIVTLGAPVPPGSSGPLASAFGYHAAKIIYTFLWGGEAVLLAIAKFFGLRRLRKWTLFAVYLTFQFALVLSISLRGITPRVINSLIITGLSAWLWLRAKLQDDYVAYDDLETFDD